RALAALAWPPPPCCLNAEALAGAFFGGLWAAFARLTACGCFLAALAALPLFLLTSPRSSAALVLLASVLFGVSALSLGFAGRSLRSPSLAPISWREAPLPSPRAAALSLTFAASTPPPLALRSASRSRACACCSGEGFQVPGRSPVRSAT